MIQNSINTVQQYFPPTLKSMTNYSIEKASETATYTTTLASKGISQLKETTKETILSGIDFSFRKTNQSLELGKMTLQSIWSLVPEPITNATHKSIDFTKDATNNTLKLGKNATQKIGNTSMDITSFFVQKLDNTTEMVSGIRVFGFMVEKLNEIVKKQ